MRELFVYYRVAGERAFDAAQCVRRFQDDLRAAHPGLTARWLKREPAADSPAAVEPTWMEIYASDAALPGGGITDDLCAAIDRAAAVLQPYLRSPRHSEVFVACAS